MNEEGKDQEPHDRQYQDVDGKYEDLTRTALDRH